MWLLIITFILLVVVTTVAIEIRERRRAAGTTAQTSEKSTPAPAVDNNCCGMHLVCERESLLSTNDKIEYYDDEELDQLAGIRPEDYNDRQKAMIAEVFTSMRAEDVIGWVRSLQLRSIELPYELRDEVLMVVREQRAARNKV